MPLSNLHRWIGQIIGHPFSPLSRRHSRTTQHPIKDVAVVAQDASRHLGIVAMVCARSVSDTKFALANCTQPVLTLEGLIVKFLGKTGPVFALCSKLCSPRIWVFVAMLLFCFAGLVFRFICFSVDTALSKNFWLRIMRFSALFNFRTLGIFTKSCACRLNIFVAIFLASAKVIGPLFRCAVSFSHSRSLA